MLRQLYKNKLITAKNSKSYVNFLKIKQLLGARPCLILQACRLHLMNNVIREARMRRVYGVILERRKAVRNTGDGNYGVISIYYKITISCYNPD